MTETLIIGGGLTGLFLGHRLHLAGHKVTLLEGRESLGGRYRRPGQTLPYASPGLDFIPATEAHLQVLAWLKNLSPIPFHYEVCEQFPQVFDEGMWKPFAGFGDSHFLSVGELSALFAHTSYVNLQPGLEHLVRALVEQLPFAAHTMSRVTGMKIADGKISEVTVNGDKVVRGDQVIFTPHPAQLNDLMAGDDLPAKHRTRLAKMQCWTAVTLQLTHTSPLLNDNSVRFFSHNAKEFEPVVGRAWGSTSKWLTLIPSEREAEHEFTGQCIRHIKRQLKRAWPEGLSENGTSEKIFVQANAYGQHSLRCKETCRFPEISNLYVANHTLAGVPGELAALEPVQALESSLGSGLNKLPELGASC